MSPGRLDKFTPARCSECRGWDMGGVGVIHHKPGCMRGPYCAICGMEVSPGQQRTVAPPKRHLDCALDYEFHLDEEHRGELP